MFEIWTNINSQHTTIIVFYMKLCGTTIKFYVWGTHLPKKVKHGKNVLVFYILRIYAGKNRKTKNVGTWNFFFQIRKTWKTSTFLTWLSFFESKWMTWSMMVIVNFYTLLSNPLIGGKLFVCFSLLTTNLIRKNI